jgi:hypothetical protein
MLLLPMGRAFVTVKATRSVAGTSSSASGINDNPLGTWSEKEAATKAHKKPRTDTGVSIVTAICMRQ